MHDDGNQWEAGPLYHRDKFWALGVARGTTCTQFIIPYAVCGPCRHTYWSGQYSGTNNISNSSNFYLSIFQGGTWPKATTTGFTETLASKINGLTPANGGSAHVPFNYTDYLPTWIYGTPGNRKRLSGHIGKTVNGWENADPTNNNPTTDEKGCWPKFMFPGFDYFVAPTIAFEEKDNIQAWEQINNLDGTPASQFLYPYGVGDTRKSPASDHATDYYTKHLVRCIRNFASRKNDPNDPMFQKGFYVECWPTAPHGPQNPYADGSTDANYHNKKGVIYPDELWGDRFPNAPVLRITTAQRLGNVVTMTYTPAITLPVQSGYSGGDNINALTVKDMGDPVTDTAGLTFNGTYHIVSSSPGVVTCNQNGPNVTATKMGWANDFELTARNVRVHAYDGPYYGTGQGTYRPPEYDTTLTPSFIDGTNFQNVDQSSPEITTGSYGIKIEIPRMKSMVSIDDMLGSVIDELTASGEIDNTFIFIFSDNGFNTGEHGAWGGKGDVYDTNLIVPALMIGPGIPKPTLPATRLLNTAPMSIVQLAKTICDIMGVDPHPDHSGGGSGTGRNVGDPPAGSGLSTPCIIPLEGESFLPALTDPHYFDNKAYYGQGESGEHAVRTAQWKYFGFGPSADQTPQMFNLITDPWEINNLATSPPGAIQLQLQQKAAALSACHGATCFVAAP